MKSKLFTILTFFILWVMSGGVRAQVSNYAYSSPASTYTAITGGTAHVTGTFDDANYTAVPIGFTFRFNGVDYTTLGINTNGFIWFGATNPAIGLYTPISSTTGMAGVAAVFGRDMNNVDATSEIRSELTGTSPNQVFVIQWKNARRYNVTGESLNFQIRLYETTNRVEFVYGSCTGGAGTSQPQVGLRGATNSDYNNRTTTTNWSATNAGTANSSTCTLSATVFPASGLTFSWIMPTCFPVTGVATSAITQTGATITWTAPVLGTPAGYEWKVVASGAGPGGTAVSTGTTVHPTVTANATGLTASTVYDVYVRTDCGAGDYSVWSNLSSFTTQCANITTFPWNEALTSYVPICWHEAAGALATPVTFTSTTSSSWIADGFGNVGTTGAARLNIFGTAPREWLISPAIDLGTGVNYQLEFDLALTAFGATTNPATTGADDRFVVVISTDGGATWSAANVLREWNNSGSTYVYNSLVPAGTHVVIPLTGYTGVVQIGFYGESTIANADNDLFIDNVKIQAIPSCPAPTALGISSLTSSSANLTWTAGGTETLWNIEYGLFGFTPTGTPTNTGVSNPYALTGLSSATQYSYYVQSDCGGGSTSGWAGPYSFTTLCNDITAFPYTEGFELVAFPPVCWQTAKVLGTGTPGNFDRQTAGTNPTCTPHSGAAMSRFAAYNYAAGTIGILATAPLNIPSANYEVRFWMYRDAGYATTADSLTVLVNGSQSLTGATRLGVINRAHSLAPVETAAGWYEYSFDIPVSGAGNYIVFAATSRYGNNIFIDDVTIQEKASCPQVTGLTVNNISTGSAQVNWVAGGTETNWNIEYGPAGFTQGTGTAATASTTPTALISGLTSNTDYDVYVQANCGGSTSTWTGPISFTTSCDPLSVPYTELFNSATWPDCWAQSFAGGVTSNRWSVSATTFAGGTANEMGAQYVNLTGTSRLISPVLNTTGVTSLQLRFKTYFDDYGTGCTLKIQTTNDGMTWTDESWSYASGSGDIDAGTEVVVNIANNLGGNMAIAWTIDGNHYQFDGWFIDSVVIKTPNTAAEILTFTLPQQTGPATITSAAGTVAIEVAYGTDVTALTPAITVSSGATIVPASGATQDFTTPVSYVVTAEDNVTTKNWTATVTVAAPSAAAEILTFTVPGMVGAETINSTAGTVTVTVPFGTDVTTLVPTITISQYATINPLSGVAQDFSSPFTYAVTAQDGTVKNWVVTVIVEPLTIVKWTFPNNPDDNIADGGIAPNLAKVITNNATGTTVYNAAGATTSAVSNTGWDNGMDAKYYEVEFTTTGYKDIILESKQRSSGTGPKDFKIQIKQGATGTYTDVPGAVITVGNNFTSGVYPATMLPVEANNQTSLYVRWIMSSNASVGGATVAATGTSRIDDIIVTGSPLSSENDIITFSIPQQASAAVIDAGNHTVSVSVPFGTNVNGLTPTLTVSPFATVTPASGATQDFTGSVVYAVTAEDGTLQNWTVTVTTLPASSEKEILTFTIPSQVGSSVINSGAATVAVTMPFGTNVTVLDPTITVSPFATINPASGTTQDFTNPVVYAVTAQDGTVKNWTVTVTVEAGVTDLTISDPADGTNGEMCGMSATEQISITIQNVGNMTVPTGTLIELHAIVQGTAPVTENLTLTSDLLPSATVSYQFANTFAMGALGSYDWKFYLVSASDLNHVNDTVDGVITHIVAGVDINGADTIEVLATALPYTLDISTVWETYAWEDASGNVISTTNSASATAFGWYYLTVTNASTECSAIDSVYLAEYIEVTDIAVVNPEGGNFTECGLTATEPLAVTIENVGNTTIPTGTILVVHANADNNAPQTENFTLTSDLLPGGQVMVPFTNPINFSAIQLYNFIIYVEELSGDANQNNDTTQGTIDHIIASVSIDGTDTISVLSTDMPYALSTQDVYDNYIWTNETGDTISTLATASAVDFGWDYLSVSNQFNNCEAVDSVYIDMLDAMGEIAASRIAVYPNPASEFVSIAVSGSDGANVISLMTPEGQLVVRKNISGNNFVEKLDVSGFASGIYLLEVRNGNKTTTTKLVVR